LKQQRHREREARGDPFFCNGWIATRCKAALAMTVVFPAFFLKTVSITR
jgi:hypothetical protein